MRPRRGWGGRSAVAATVVAGLRAMECGSHSVARATTGATLRCAAIRRERLVLELRASQVLPPLCVVTRSPAVRRSHCYVLALSMCRRTLSSLSLSLLLLAVAVVCVCGWVRCVPQPSCFLCVAALRLSTLFASPPSLSLSSLSLSLFLSLSLALSRLPEAYYFFFASPAWST